MRFLVDESLSQRVARLLVDSGHDAVHVGDIGLLGAPDQEVMRAAADASRVLVSTIPDLERELRDGAVVVLTAEKIRFRLLPIDRNQ